MKEPKCYLSEHPRLEATQEFIDRNRFSLSRTQDEIVGRIGDNSDYFGFSAEVLFEYLDLDRATWQPTAFWRNTMTKWHCTKCNAEPEVGTIWVSQVRDAEVHTVCGEFLDLVEANNDTHTN